MVLGTYLSAIRNFHLALGLPWVDIRDRYRVGWCLKGLRRLRSTQVGRTQAPYHPGATSKDAFVTLCTSIEREDPRMVVLWAVMLLAFFTMSRKDNFSVEKIDAFNARQHLTRGDVKIMRSSVLCSFLGGRSPTS